jgi:NAD(P)-dependent dehydrogenase (short-subunit alcohol dehydrogenase family)
MGRVAVVTGAASGIGAAACLRLAAEGARVACLDINVDGASQTAAAAGHDSFPIGVDLADEGQVQAAVVRAAEQAGAIDILVNCAGIAGPQQNAAATTAAEWDQTQVVNLRGTFLMARHALPYLVASRGVIVNIASALGFVGWRSECAYGPSKAGVVQLTKGMALDYAPKVRVNCVCPGAVRTPMISSVLEGAADIEEALAEYGKIHPLYGRLAWPEEIADAVLFLVSADASFITGIALPVDGGFLAAGRGTGNPEEGDIR